MAERIVSRRDPELGARVSRGEPLYYEEGADAHPESLPYVRAGSSLAALGGRIAVVGDDTNFVALIDRDSRKAECVPLPAGRGGERLFDEEHGNRRWKLDLEACVAVPVEGGELLVAFGSGSSPEREHVVALSWVDGEPAASVHEASALYAALRAEQRFAGSGLNLEGAVYLEGGTMRLFQRGNMESDGGLEPVDATCDLPWPELWAHLRDPGATPPPAPREVVAYDLGALDGVRLTFSDAEPAPGGGILYAASAEGTAEGGRDGEIVGSALGIIAPDGEARWGELTDEAGRRFHGKVEGLSLDPRDPLRVYFVVDMDDPDTPSELYEATLSGPWYG